MKPASTIAGELRVTYVSESTLYHVIVIHTDVDGRESLWAQYAILFDPSHALQQPYSGVRALIDRAIKDSQVQPNRQGGEAEPPPIVSKVYPSGVIHCEVGDIQYWISPLGDAKLGSPTRICC